MPSGNGTDYAQLQNHVAFYRKPFAYAHSMFGVILNKIRAECPMFVFKKEASYHGFIPSEDTPDEDFDAFAIIAEHYRIAAENELTDAPDCAVFWWAYASNMARAKANSGYTLGALRCAIESAQDAEKSRDVYLFGEAARGVSHLLIAKLTASRFQDEEDTFLLPCVELKRPEEGKSTLEVNGEVICWDFDKIEEEDYQLFDARNPSGQEQLDTTEVTKAYGPEAVEIPSLETLCISELHKAGYNFARQETDGAVIVCKAMMAAEKQAQDRSYSVKKKNTKKEGRSKR